MKSEVQDTGKRMLALVGVLKRMLTPTEAHAQVLRACAKKLWVGYTKN